MLFIKKSSFICFYSNLDLIILGLVIVHTGPGLPIDEGPSSIIIFKWVGGGLHAARVAWWKFHFQQAFLIGPLEYAPGPMLTISTSSIGFSESPTPMATMM